MGTRSVQIHVGGQPYRVVTTASDEEVQGLAAVVDEKLRSVTAPGRPVTPQSLLLAALALAHDLETERARSQAFAERARASFGRILERVDGALGSAQAGRGLVE